MISGFFSWLSREAPCNDVLAAHMEVLVIDRAGGAGCRVGVVMGAHKALLPTSLGVVPSVSRAVSSAAGPGLLNPGGRPAP